MWLECWWRHAQKRWAENLEDFEKDSVEVRPWCWEVGARPWCCEVGARTWYWEVEIRPWIWETEIGPCRQTVEFSVVAVVVKFFGSRPAKMNWDLKHHEMCRTLGMVSIVRIMSLSSCRRTEVKKLIKPVVPEQRSPLVLSSPVFSICLYLHL